MLHIYKASAGSGKTHLLTGFFLQQLFRQPIEGKEEGRPLLFNEILAVTFTNKATAEMKERIIEELHKLHNEPQKSPYLKDLLKPSANGKVLSIEEIQRRSFGILSSILNDYSELHVSTIDSFFQQVLRSFAHELNLQGNYEIELDADATLDKVVSRFITGLNPSDDKETFQWMLEFASKRLNEGSAWNMHDELLKLAKVITQEEYKQNNQRIAEFTNNRKELRQYISNLREMQQTWQKALIEVGQQGVQILQSYGLLYSDFKGGSRSSMACFGRWAEGEIKDPSATLEKWSQDTAEWYKKGCEAEGKLSSSDEKRLLELMQLGVSLLTGQERAYYETARSIIKNIYQLGLLSRLETEADRYCEEEGKQLLTNTTHVLSRLIQEEEAPFIYEKTGTRIKSFMIDEFQDTSTMQWNNFKPLLETSLSTGNEDLIVGDVKQSIYRWRGSDWELLNTTIYDFHPELQHTDENGNQLKYNFRSDEKIIDFNNSFFANAAHQLAECTEDEEMKKIESIYADVKQFIHDDRKDNIGAGILDYEEVEPIDEEDEKEAILRRLPEKVIALQQQGFEPKDILILGRFNKECKLFAETLLNYKKQHPDCPYQLDIITDEALSLGNRDVIRAIVAMLQAIYEPKSELRQTIAHCCYLKACGMTMTEAIATHFSFDGKQNDKAGKQADNTHNLPNFLQFSNQPLFEMVEGIVSLMPQQQQRDSVFLQAFRDLVLEYVSKRGTDIGGFLKWWRDKGSSSSISTPAGQNAIKIMTIHKSKGLGEKAVIIPFADWKIDIDTSHGEVLWLDPHGFGFTNEDSTPEQQSLRTDASGEGQKNIILPIQIEASLPKTIFNEEFTKERMRAITDNLNTAYVAFTRAKKAMVIMAPAPKKSKTSKNDKKSVPTLAELLNSFMQKWKDNIDHLEPQELQDSGSTEKSLSEQTEKAQQPDNKPSESALQSSASAPRPQIKRTTHTGHDVETGRGTTLHNALSVVKYSDNYEAPIRKLFISGNAELVGFELDELINTVGELLQWEQVAPWFSRSNHVLNEQNIVTHTTHTQRPDRIIFTPDGRVIIIDYKTGTTHSSKYHKQVDYYMKLMRDMGYRKVEGYLWYIDQKKIEKVQHKAKSVQLTLDFS
ncbi:MAG: UvrD-helicase domain-containing protein [Bacteroidales bacterium]|nr:UvrD-helicase domain-containing protein [Bacteroidales bacterium]